MRTHPSREVVCSDTGEAFVSAAAAAEAVNRQRWGRLAHVTARDVWRAIMLGKSIAWGTPPLPHFYDWRWPEGHRREGEMSREGVMPSCARTG